MLVDLGVLKEVSFEGDVYVVKIIIEVEVFVKVYICLVVEFGI